ncbi:PilN domain-containing protein [Patescibacteria group bacterium]
MSQFKLNINLLPKEQLDSTAVGKFLKWALTFGRYIVIFTELIVIIAFIYRFKLDKDLIKLNSEIEQKSAIITSQQEFENTTRLLQKRLELIKETHLKNLFPSVVLEELARILPLDLVIDDLGVDNSSVKIKGKALSKEGLSTFFQGLQNSEHFTNINLDSVSSKGKKNPNITFSLSLKLIKLKQ